MVTTKQVLNALKRDTYSIKLAGKARSQEWNVRRGISRDLRTKFVEEALKYQTAQKQFKSNIDNEIRIAVRVKRPNVNEDEMSAVLNRTKKSETLMNVQDEFDMTPSTEDLILRIAFRYPELQLIEQSLSELHESFYYYFLLAQEKGNSPLGDIEDERFSSRGYQRRENTNYNRAKTFWRLAIAHFR
jgi:t-SNARE complex subunit (syntaxin)